MTDSEMREILERLIAQARMALELSYSMRPYDLGTTTLTPGEFYLGDFVIRYRKPQDP